MTRSTHRALLLLRLGLGIVFVMHGWQKLAVYGHDGVTAMLTGLGFPFPSFNAALITAAELGGGLAMLAGLATRAAGLVLAFSMTVAIATVHLSQGFFAPTGFEYPLTLLVVSLALTMTGAGAYSVDARLATRRRAAAAQVNPPRRARAA